tara:strand:+ start:2479 stop:3687 length:1209 start_codon:yes stop_codon:yes gene_type:complete
MLIGIDKFDKRPIDNCIEYTTYNFSEKLYNPCDTAFVIYEIINDENIKLISNIKDEKYIYPVCVKFIGHALGCIVHRDVNPVRVVDKTFLDFISKKALNDIQMGVTKLLVYQPYEGNNIHQDSLFAVYDVFKQELVRKKIPVENVIYSDANVLLNEESNINDIKLVVVNHCANTVHMFNNTQKQNLYHGSHEESIKNRKLWEDSKNQIRDKYFLCYNRQPKSHRKKMVEWLKSFGYLDSGLVSLSPDLILDIVDDPIVDKFSNIDTVISHYLDTYFTICTETNYDDRNESGNAVLLSEKIWKPITNFHPFILVSNAKSLNKLKEYGFKTFEPFIDESYDNINDKDKRFLAICREIEKLCNKPIEEIHEWYWSIEEILKHNYYHFYNEFVPNEKQRFLNEIQL